MIRGIIKSNPLRAIKEKKFETNRFWSMLRNIFFNTDDPCRDEFEHEKVATLNTNEFHINKMLIIPNSRQSSLGCHVGLSIFPFSDNAGEISIDQTRSGAFSFSPDHI